MADASRGKGRVTVQLPLASRDRIAIQARDAGQERDPAATVLLCQEAREQTSRALVSQSDQSVDTAVLFRCRPVGVLPTTAHGQERAPDQLFSLCSLSIAVSPPAAKARGQTGSTRFC